MQLLSTCITFGGLKDALLETGKEIIDNQEYTKAILAAAKQQAQGLELKQSDTDMFYQNTLQRRTEIFQPPIM